MSTPIIKKWNLTVESPTKVMRALEDFLHDDLDYPITELKQPELVGTAIEGTARFEGEIRGVKSYNKRSMISVIIGIILALLGIWAIIEPSVSIFGGFLLLIVGIILLIKSKRLASIIIGIKMEGESYRAGAGKETDMKKDRDKTERIGVISDARLTVYGKVEGGYGNAEIKLLNLNMEALVKKFETELIPKFRLPEIKQ